MNTAILTNIQRRFKELSFQIKFINDNESSYINTYTLKFNNDIVIYNSAIIEMFNAIIQDKKNEEFIKTHNIIIDIAPDVDLYQIRKSYNNVLLIDGGGLDSNSIKILFNNAKIYDLKTCVIKNLKSHEIENISNTGILSDNDNNLVMSFDFPKNINGLNLNVKPPYNYGIITTLVIDHFKAKKILTGAFDQSLYTEYYKTARYYKSNFLIGNLTTSYINALFDKNNYYNRLIDCGRFPYFKDIRKLIYTKYLDLKYNLNLLDNNKDIQFIEHNRINLTAFNGWFNSIKSKNNLFKDYLYVINSIGKKYFYNIFKTEAERNELNAIFQYINEVKQNNINSIKFVDLKLLFDTFNDMPDIYDKLKYTLTNIFDEHHFIYKENSIFEK